jgi:hypothetical protein
MMSLRSIHLPDFSLPYSSVRLLTNIAEAKGRQTLTARWTEKLTSLRQTALVQSVESSNRIEGVTVAPDRLRPLVLEDARPRDRSEEEIQGYRRALELIHAEAQNLAITPERLQRLHATIQEGSGDAGQWRRVNNESIELREGAAPVVRFRPVGVAETPAAVDELCLLYRHALNQDLAPPLVAVAALAPVVARLSAHGEDQLQPVFGGVLLPLQLLWRQLPMQDPQGTGPMLQAPSQSSEQYATQEHHASASEHVVTVPSQSSDVAGTLVQ